MKPTILRYAACLLLLTSIGSNACAQPSPQGATSGLRQWAEQDYLFGDWSGARTALSRRGIDLEFFYAGSLPDNLDGGLRRGSVYQGGLMMLLDLDSQKLLGYEGGSFHASGLWLHGQKPFSDQYVGDLNKVNLLDFGNAARLWELWYQQKLFEGKLAVKMGQLSIDRDFILPEYYGSLGQSAFINQTFFLPTLPFSLFDVPGLPPRHHGLAASPMAAPGVVTRLEPSKALYLQAGVYGGSPDQTYSGTRFNLSEQGGALSFFELGYRLNAGTNRPGLGGSYKVGTYYHTGDFVDLHDGLVDAFARQASLPSPGVRDHHGNYGAYLLTEQQLYLEQGKADPAQQGLVGFFRLLGAPADRNLAQVEVDGGLIYKGLFPGRDWDTLGLSVSYLGISDDLRAAQGELNRLAPGAFVVADHETVVELSYKFQMTAWWTLQPSFQHVWHPGGSAAIPDASVLIFQTTLRF